LQHSGGDKSKHSVSYTLSRTQAVVVEYEKDEHTDMFQIGRSSETPIDFVVTDTLPGRWGCSCPYFTLTAIQS